MKENHFRRFAQGLSFSKIFLFFLLGSFFGSCFEEIVYYVSHGSWTHREDLILGPFSTLYGWGVVLFLLLLRPDKKQRSVFSTVLFGALIGGTAEFLTSFLLEYFLGAKFWDYSNMALNFQGRTTIPIMILWGVFGAIFIKIIYPPVSLWIEKIPSKIGHPIVIFLFILVLLDIFLSYSAYLRMLKRNKGQAPKTFIGEYYDQVFDNEFMYKHFPILDGK